MNPNAPRKKPTCYHCGSDPGHFRKDCPTYHCHWCKKVAPGHHQRHCPDKPSKWDGAHTNSNENCYGLDDDLYGDGES